MGRLVRHRRVHGYFENSINLAPPFLVLLFTPSTLALLLLSVSLSVSPHTSTARASERWNFLVVPISRYSRGVLGRDPIYPGLSAPKAPIATPALLIWSESTFYPLSIPYAPLHVHCLPLISSSNSFYLCESIVGHDLDAIKDLTRSGRETTRWLINAWESKFTMTMMRKTWLHSSYRDRLMMLMWKMTIG